MTARSIRLCAAGFLTVTALAALLSCSAKTSSPPDVLSPGGVGGGGGGEPPVISSVTPTSTCSTAGNVVTLQGVNLTLRGESPAVTINGVSATVVMVVNGPSPSSTDEITVRTGAQAGAIPAGGLLATVRITTEGGSDTLADVLRLFPACQAPPQLIGISPATAPREGGLSMTLSGTGLACVTDVQFVGTTDGRRLTGTVIGVTSDSSIQVKSPINADTSNQLYDVFAFIDSNRDAVADCGVAQLAGAVTFAGGTTGGGSAPNATAIFDVTTNLPQGPASGGNRVQITGTDLTTVTSISVGTVTLTTADFTLDASGNIIIPAMPLSPGGSGAPLEVQVVVRAGTAADATPLRYMYLAAGPPVCASFTPNSGKLSGGDVVTITATNIDQVTRVTFGGVPVTQPIVVDRSSGVIIVKAPSYPTPRSVSIVLETGADPNFTPVSTCPLTFTYVDQSPNPTFEVTSVAPSSGLQTGDTALQLRGSGLDTVTEVTVCGVPAQITEQPVDSLVKAKTGLFGGAVPKVCDVVVRNSAGETATLVGGFTYLPVVPNPTGYAANSARSAPAAGGTTFRIVGTNFIGVTGVRFGGTQAGGGVAACDVQVQGNTEISGTIPAYVTPGGPFPAPVTVIVESVAGSEALSQPVTYDANPTMASAFGPGGSTVSAGDLITVRGAKFKPLGDQFVASVELVNSGVITGTSAGTERGFVPFSVVDDSTLQFFFPAFLTQDRYDITIRTPNQQSSCVDQYSFTLRQALFYGQPPSAARLQPNRGRFQGGTTVVISGDFSTPVTDVTICGVSQTVQTSLQTRTSVTIVTKSVAESSAGVPCDVVVINEAGGSVPISGAFTFIADPEIFSVETDTENCGTLNTSATRPLPVQQGQTITIRGDDLTGVNHVFVGTQEASIIDLGRTDTSIDVTVPTAPTAGGPVFDVRTEARFDTPPGGGAADPSYSDIAGGAVAYQARPVVTALAPPDAPAGDPISFTGTALRNITGAATRVLFGATPATVISTADTTLTVIVPPGTPGQTVLVSIATCQGTATISYTYPCNVPDVTGIAPTSGAGGDVVTLTGTDLVDPSGNPPTVIFDIVPATVLTATPTSVTVTVPTGTIGTAVDVTLMTCGGTDNAPSQFRYQCNAPTITSLAPAFGRVGTQVTISGINLDSPDGSGVTVRFGATPAAVGAVTSTSITVTAPAGTGTVDVTVVTCGGSTTSAGAFTYCVLPSATSILPLSGPAGQLVGIGGTALQDPNGTPPVVTFTAGGNSRTAVVIGSSPTLVQVEAPAGLSGLATVTLTTCGGSSSPGVFRFCAAPSISSVAPLVGGSGTQVTLTGSNFIGSDGVPGVVRFGGVQATNVIQATNTQFVVVAPAGPTGATAVTITTCGGTATAGDLFAYCVTPAITGLTPTNGPAGTEVTIDGAALLGADGTVGVVTFSTTEANVISSSPTRIVVVAPTGFAAGTVVNVRVRTCGGVSNANTFTYQVATTCIPPTVSQLAPTAGAAGSLAVISGTNLVGNDRVPGVVTFGGAVAAPVSSTPTTLVVTVPPGVGLVEVKVTTCGGSATASTPFRYCLLPSISAIDKTTGGPGTIVTLSGTALVGADGAPTTVTFGDTEARVVDASAGQLVVEAPGGFAAGTAVSVRATTCGGTATAPSTFTYTGVVNCTAPVVAAITPSAGVAGISVTITGTNVAGADGATPTVTFGGIAAVVVSKAPGRLVVTVPAGAGTQTVRVTTCGGSADAPTAFTYCTPPTVTAPIAPATGPAGTVVTITGTGFIGADGAAPTVTFGTATAQVLDMSATSLVVTAPAGIPAGTMVTVNVTTCGGTVPAPNKFTYTAAGTCVAPSVTSIAPTSGKAGDTVTIVGTNLASADSSPTTVTFGGAPATVLSTTSTRVTVTVPAGAGSVAVRLTTCGGSADAPQLFTYCVIPDITVPVAPASGAPDTVVTITGTNLVGADGAAPVVTFGTTQAAIIDQRADRILAVAPTGIPVGTAVSVNVSTCGGSDTASNQFTYTAPQGNCSPPVITSISPTAGIAGSQVTILGSNLASADASPTTVTFGGVAATVVTTTNGRVVVNVPAGAGVVAVRLTTCGGSVDAPQPFTYCTAPAITAPISPVTGPADTVVTIIGTNLVGADNATPLVTFGSVPATLISATSTRIQAIAPAGIPAGTAVTVNVTTCGGVASSSPTQFTYTTPGTCTPPAVTSIAPTSGQAGTQVTILGSNLKSADSSATIVLFGAAPATVLSTTNTVVVVQVPAGAGSVAVHVTTCGGSADAPQLFTYCVSPNITAPISPTSGPTGTVVTITGNNLVGADGAATTVTFGTTQATIVDQMAGTILALAPAGIPLNTPVNVSVTTCGGTVTAMNQFTRTAGTGTCDAPVVSSINPTSGVAGNIVTISGSDFIGADGNPTQVFFGATPATIITRTNSVLTVTVPGGAGLVAVHVSTCGGTADAPQPFAYCTLPAITMNIAPASGGAGTIVTIRGTNLVGADGNAPIVLFGTTSATVVDQSATQLLAEAPGGIADGTAVFVKVTTCGGTATSPNQFTYLPEGTCVTPTVSSISPTAGPAGGTLTISGANLKSPDGTPTVVLFGAAPATVLSTQPTRVIVTIPAGAGDVVIHVTTCGGSADAPGLFRYCAVPTINNPSGIQPNNGAVGSLVTINGMNLVGADGDAPSVMFGNFSATIVDQSATRLQVTVPGGPVSGTQVNVRVTTCGGTATAVEKFTYTSTTSFDVTSITPATGPNTGGQVITIRGTGLTNVNAVEICQTSVANIDPVNDTTVNAQTGAFTGAVPSTCDVVVHTSTGLIDTLPMAYTYTGAVPDGQTFQSPAGTEAAVTAPASGGTAFRIFGTSLIGVTSISFGGHVNDPSACNIHVESDTQLTGIAPNYITPTGPFPATVEVFPESAAGSDPTTVVVSPGVLFTFYADPAAQSAAASGGSPAGFVKDGEQVTVTGTSFMDPALQTAFVGSARIVNSGALDAENFPRETFVAIVPVNVINGTTLTFNFPRASRRDAYDITISVPNIDLDCVRGEAETGTSTLGAVLTWCNGTPSAPCGP